MDKPVHKPAEADQPLLTPDDVRAAAKRIAADHGRKAVGIAVDVCQGTGVETMVQRAIAEFGRIDILVNNAGINIRGPIDDLPEPEKAPQELGGH